MILGLEDVNTWVRPYPTYVRKGDVMKFSTVVGSVISGLSSDTYTAAEQNKLKSFLSNNAGFLGVSVDISGVQIFSGGLLFCQVTAPQDYSDIADVASIVEGNAYAAGYAAQSTTGQFVTQIGDNGGPSVQVGDPLAPGSSGGTGIIQNLINDLSGGSILPWALAAGLGFLVIKEL